MSRKLHLCDHWSCILFISWFQVIRTIDDAQATLVRPMRLTLQAALRGVESTLLLNLLSMSTHQQPSSKHDLDLHFLNLDLRSLDSIKRGSRYLSETGVPLARFV